jgi:hypothetical protein
MHNQAPKKCQSPRNQSQSAADGSEHGVGGIAIAFCDVISVLVLVGFEMPDDEFDGVAARA